MNLGIGWDGRPRDLWPQGLIDQLYAIRRQVRETIALGQHAVLDDQRTRLQAKYDRGVAAGMQAPAGTVKRSRVKQPKARNLLERRNDHATVARFKFALRAPYTNNRVEQDIT